MCYLHDDLRTLVVRVRLLPKILVSLVDHGLDVAVFTEFLNDSDLRAFGIVMIISFAITNINSILTSTWKINLAEDDYRIDMVTSAEYYCYTKHVVPFFSLRKNHF